MKPSEIFLIFFGVCYLFQIVSCLIMLSDDRTSIEFHRTFKTKKEFILNIVIPFYWLFFRVCAGCKEIFKNIRIQYSRLK